MPESAKIIIVMGLMGILWTLFTGNLWHLAITVGLLAFYFGARYLDRYLER